MKMTMTAPIAAIGLVACVAVPPGSPVGVSPVCVDERPGSVVYPNDHGGSWFELDGVRYGWSTSADGAECIHAVTR